MISGEGDACSVGGWPMIGPRGRRRERIKAKWRKSNSFRILLPFWPGRSLSDLISKKVSFLLELLSRNQRIQFRTQVITA
jgi:hypothetical protein